MSPNTRAQYTVEHLSRLTAICVWRANHTPKRTSCAIHPKGVQKMDTLAEGGARFWTPSPKGTLNPRTLSARGSRFATPFGKGATFRDPFLPIF